MRGHGLRHFALGVLVGGALLLSCGQGGGIRQRVYLLRAQKIELIDSSNRVQMDVGTKVLELERRLAALEVRSGGGGN